MACTKPLSQAGTGYAVFVVVVSDTTNESIFTNNRQRIGSDLSVTDFIIRRMKKTVEVLSCNTYSTVRIGTPPLFRAPRWNTQAHRSCPTPMHPIYQRDTSF